LVDRVNRLFGVAMLRLALGKIGFRRIVTWFVLPHPGLFAGTLNEEFVVYYCIDHYAALPGVNARQTSLMDEHLSRVADQIFVASDTLLPVKQKLNSHVMHSPHGVDFDLFSRAGDPREPVAAALRDIPHPVIGFFGVVRDWIDIELLEFIARARPDWTLLIVGMVVSDAASLKRLSNVIFTGAKPYRDLPQWAKPFDVAIMPYRTEKAAHASPLKLREYLATGKPVVSVSMPLVEQYSEYVYIANEPEAFVRQIERALREDSPELRERRMRAVADVTWDTRVAEITEFVGREIAARGKQNGSNR
jgi:glycosyltransferase involved in cell wall biosynthesis